MAAVRRSHVRASQHLNTQPTLRVVGNTQRHSVFFVCAYILRHHHVEKPFMQQWGVSGKLLLLPVEKPVTGLYSATGYPGKHAGSSTPRRRQLKNVASSPDPRARTHRLLQAGQPCILNLTPHRGMSLCAGDLATTCTCVHRYGRTPR